MTGMKKVIVFLLVAMMFFLSVPFGVLAEEISNDPVQGLEVEKQNIEDMTENDEVNNDELIEKNVFGQNDIATETAKTSIHFARGNGSEENPYQIENAEQLNAIREDLEASYILIKDIDLSGYSNWEPIGSFDINQQSNTSTMFQGSIDGQNHKIKNLTINRKDNARSGGLFGDVLDNQKVKIKNITCENVNIQGEYNAVGALIGNIYYEWTNGMSTVEISNCIVQGKIQVENSFVIGGLIGYAGQSQVSNCISTIEISANYDNGRNTGVTIGGIIGGSDYQQTLKQCINYGNLESEDYTSIHMGGIAGNGYVVEECYNSGNINVIQASNGRPSQLLIGGIQGGFGSFGPDSGVNNRFYKIKNCQNASEEINVYQKNSNELSTCLGFAYRIINYSANEQFKLENNLAWIDTKINKTEVPENDSQEGLDKKHGKGVLASEIDERIRPKDTVKKGFNIWKDSWPIANSYTGLGMAYAGFDSENKPYQIPLERYIEVFGKSGREFYENQTSEEKKWGGNCFGMVSTAVLNYHKVLNLSDNLNQNGYDDIGWVEDSEKNKYNLPHLSQNSFYQKIIETYQIMQNSDMFDKPTCLIMTVDKSDPEKIQDLLELLESSNNPYLIGVKWNEKDPNSEKMKRDGHMLCVNSIHKPQKEIDGKYKVNLYNPNKPYCEDHDGIKNSNENRVEAISQYLDINTTTGDWEIKVGSNADAEKNLVGYRNRKPLSDNEGDTLFVYDLSKFNYNPNEKLTFKPIDNEVSSYLYIDTNDCKVSTQNGETILEIEDGKIKTKNEAIQFYELFEMSENMNGKVVLPNEKYVIDAKGPGVFELISSNHLSSVDTDGKAEIIINSKQNALEVTAEDGGSVRTVLQNFRNDDHYSAINITNNLKSNDKIKLQLTQEDIFSIDAPMGQKGLVKIDSDIFDDRKEFANLEVEKLNKINIVDYVNYKAIDNISLNTTKLNLRTSEAVQLTATITPENATNKNVSWTSSDEKVATVKGGVVTAVGEGKATITVTTEDGNKTAECTVTVTKKEEPTPVEPTTPTVEPENNNPSGNNGTKTDTTVQTAAKNNSSNPSTSLTNQEKISTLLVMCTVTALCALAIFSIKRKQTK